MFQFPPFATHTYGFSMGRFGHPGINARLTASPGFSQSSTPFFALWRLGIPHTPLVAWPRCSCPLSRAVFTPRSERWNRLPRYKIHLPHPVACALG